MSDLELYAGPTALARIQQEGVKPEMFKAIAGASGGPKWFVLYGLDRYLFGDFFAKVEHSIATVGSSAGAWRLACMGLDDPLAGIDRLAEYYSHQEYSNDPDVDEISAEANKLLDIVLGPEGVEQIASNRAIDMHIIVARSRGLVARDSPLPLMAGLGLCALSNIISRKLIGLSFQRYVFHTGKLLASTEQWPGLKTHSVSLNIDNIRQALLASGSIPMVMRGIVDIEHAQKGVYRDGGLTDYHLDLPLIQGRDLVLYPHFYSRITPGWFDKFVPWRRPNIEHFDNVLMLVPSKSFVDSLPYGKIPDRKDFENLGFEERLAYWQEVLERSAALAQDFSLMVESGRGIEAIRPISDIA
ncbi:MAG: patatin-like phospholipase family protein [Pseudohongiellaceae bacterium]|nr:patatin-like phospholipase family protein [Pseudohongiellaceae bacterium]